MYRFDRIGCLLLARISFDNIPSPIWDYAGTSVNVFWRDDSIVIRYNTSLQIFGKILL